VEFLDNKGSQRLGAALESSIDKDAQLSIISAYFTIFAYGELKESLSKVESLRFIFSEPTFIERMHEDKDPREFVLAKHSRERGIAGTGLELTLRNNVNQRALARECAEWARNKVRFKSAKYAGAIQTGSLYHVDNASQQDHGFMGTSSPFTLEGLGYERRPGIVTGVSHFQTSSEAVGLKETFDGLWDDSGQVEDVTEQVIEQIGTLYRENPPEFIYFLTLYHVFRDFMESSEEELIDPALRFQESVIWNKLYNFQRDAVVGAIHKLEKYKGCIIADSVGLGKTFEGLAVIKYYQLRNARTLVLTPKRLRDNWTLWLQNDTRNTLAEDRFDYTVLNHTDLSRFGGKSGDVNLETLNWGNFNLLVIDESHNFRNKPTGRQGRSRYERLMEEVIRSGVRTKVLMLSATPVNNRLLDLRNQIEIISEGDDAFLSATDDILSVSAVTRLAQQRYKEWSELPNEERTTESFVDSVNSDYFKLLDVLTIARSRKHIAKYYSGSGGAKFPQRRKPISFSPSIDAKGEMPPIDVLNDKIASLTFAQYQMLDYVLPERREKYERRYGDSWGSDFDAQVHRSNAVAVLMRVNLLKRLESSISSFGKTLGHVLATTVRLQAAIEAAEEAAGYDSGEFEGEFDDEEDAQEFESGGRVRVDVRDTDQLRLAGDLTWDRQILEGLLGYADAVTPERDEKLVTLRRFIRDKVESPFNPGNRKVLVFSAFADTARYLYDQLSGPLGEHGLESGLVTGAKGTASTLGSKSSPFDVVLGQFSPKSKETPARERARGEIDVVFATDCISEGQNLQDCDCVVNYDIHWNPVRIIQRFGRVDRLGSDNESVQLVNFWPDVDLDEYIKLESRVKGRMVMLDVSATGEENPLAYKRDDEMNDLRYRRDQLRQLKEEVLDLEDVAGGISITDFAFDDFRVELRRYSADHPGTLEVSPCGLHAVSRIPPELKGEVVPGVVFCLRQNDESRRPTDGNPTFPYYLVYVSGEGEILSRHVNPKRALDVMRGLCAGRSEAFSDLCRSFNRETRDGTRMDKYTELLNVAVSDITGIQEKKGMDSLFSLGEVGSGPALSFDDYSLVSFLVVR